MTSSLSIIILKSQILYVAQIPFPAFTVIGVNTYNHSDIRVNWLQEFRIPLTGVLTEFGWCKIANFCSRKNFLRYEAYGERIFGETDIFHDNNNLPEDETRPYKSNSNRLGFFVAVMKQQQKYYF